MKSENTVDNLLKSYTKDFGGDVIRKGSEIPEHPRIPTGIFAMDLALGGGLPKGKISMLYGKEDSGKSLLLYKIIATHQFLFPKEKCILVDIENNYETSWAEKIGIDVEALTVISPDHAAQASDMVEGLLYADGVGLVAYDSIGAMITQNELESSADKQAVGGASLLIGKMMRKIIVAQSKVSRSNDRHPSFVCVNQVRSKIGGMYANEQHLPGGSTLKYACNCIIQLYGKPVKDSKYHDTIAIKLETDAQIKKYKFPITTPAFKYNIITYPHDGLAVGECYDFNTVSHYLKDLGIMKKAEKGTGYICCNKTYKTVSELKKRYFDEKDFGANIRALITKKVLEKNSIDKPVSEQEKI